MSVCVWHGIFTKTSHEYRLVVDNAASLIGVLVTRSPVFNTTCYASTSDHSLDPQSPEEWAALRQQAHSMLDDILDYVQALGRGQVWQSAPQECANSFEPMPQEASPLEQTHANFKRDIMPYAIGNAHPGFMGWVQGGGTPAGLVAEMLAAGSMRIAVVAIKCQLRSSVKSRVGWRSYSNSMQVPVACS